MTLNRHSFLGYSWLWQFFRFLYCDDLDNMRGISQQFAHWLNTGSCLVVFSWVDCDCDFWGAVLQRKDHFHHILAKEPGVPEFQLTVLCPPARECLPVAPLWSCCFLPFTLHFWKEVCLQSPNVKDWGLVLSAKQLSTLLRIVLHEDTVFCSLIYIHMDPVLLYFLAFQDFVSNCFHELLC